MTLKSWQNSYQKLLFKNRCSASKNLFHNAAKTPVKEFAFIKAVDLQHVTLLTNEIIRGIFRESDSTCREPISKSSCIVIQILIYDLLSLRSLNNEKDLNIHKISISLLSHTRFLTSLQLHYRL